MEDIRRDVVVRRCRVHEREVDGLVDAVQKTLMAISQAKGQHKPSLAPPYNLGFNYNSLGPREPQGSIYVSITKLKHNGKSGK